MNEHADSEERCSSGGEADLPIGYERQSARHRSPTPVRSWNMMLLERNAAAQHTLTNVSVDGKQLQAFVDTGATSTFIEADVFKTMSSLAEVLLPYWHEVGTADRSILTGIKGTATRDISLTLNGVTKVIRTRIIICESLAFPVILGTGFLSEADVVIAVKDKALSFRGGANKNNSQEQEAELSESGLRNERKRGRSAC